MISINCARTFFSSPQVATPEIQSNRGFEKMKKAVSFTVTISVLIFMVLTGCQLLPVGEDFPLPSGEYVSVGSDIYLIDATSDPMVIRYYAHNSKFPDPAYTMTVRETVQDGDSGYFVAEITDSSDDYYVPAWMFHMIYSYFKEGEYTVLKWKDMSGDGSSFEFAAPYGDGTPDILLESYTTILAAVSSLVDDPSADAVFYQMFGSYNR
jgi:hypothetical protein